MVSKTANLTGSFSLTGSAVYRLKNIGRKFLANLDISVRLSSIINKEKHILSVAMLDLFMFPYYIKIYPVIENIENSDKLASQDL